jgi:hypothetical protein
LSSPNDLSNIKINNTPIRGTSDSSINFSTDYNYEPFLDNKLLDENNEFYSTGTPENILPGFSSRLSSKDSFSIDINPIEDHEVYFSTGSDYNTQAHPGISYFNFNDKKWQALGNLTNGNQFKKVDYLNKDLTIYTGSYLATIPSDVWGPDPSGVEFDIDITGVGKPTTVAGFPLDTKFNSQNGQRINLKNLINGPFLVEKIEIEISGVLGNYPAYEGWRGIRNDTGAFDNILGGTGTGTQFIILRENDLNEIYQAKSEILYKSGSSTVKENLSFNCDKIKDIVFYANIGTYGSEIDDDPYLLWSDSIGGKVINYDYDIRLSNVYENENEFLKSIYGKSYDSAFPTKLNKSGSLDLRVSELKFENFYTGSIKFSKSLQVLSNYKNSVANFTSRNLDNLKLFDIFQPISLGEEGNSRNPFNFSNGRSYTNGVIGSKILDNFPRLGITFASYETNNKISPFILDPKDNLVLACIHQMRPGQPYFFNTQYDELSLNDEKSVADIFRTKLSPGLGKITFYGSYLRDGKSLDPQSNEQLTSIAIHEDVKDNTGRSTNFRCLDQFNVEPEVSYIGNYIDNFKVSTYEGPLSFISISPAIR